MPSMSLAWHSHLWIIWLFSLSLFIVFFFFFWVFHMAVRYNRPSVHLQYQKMKMDHLSIYEYFCATFFLVMLLGKGSSVCWCLQVHAISGKSLMRFSATASKWNNNEAVPKHQQQSHFIQFYIGIYPRLVVWFTIEVSHRVNDWRIAYRACLWCGISSLMQWN